MSRLPCHAEVAFVLGTRSETAKLGPVIRRFGQDGRAVRVARHDGSRAERIGATLAELDRLFAADAPGAVVVLGGSDTALAGALAANARSIPLVRLEAGLRGHDRADPAERRRVLIDHVADLLCAPTPGNAANLRGEGVARERIAITGNPVVEAVAAALPAPEARAKLLAETGIEAARFVLTSLHRAENTQDPARLSAIMRELTALAAESGRPVLFPMSPRTRAAVHLLYADRIPAGVIACDPLDHGDFLALAKECALLITDSGAIQEEATVLGRPLILVRRATERPEALDGFAALVARPGPAIGQHARTLLADVAGVRARLEALRCPFGDGGAARRIEALIRRHVLET
jgi:UDP-N-acetylglucosamine 2-epimerase (non-hydrolysing)